MFSFRHSATTVVSAALRGVGNIVTGDDVQTQVLIKTVNVLVHNTHISQ